MSKFFINRPIVAMVISIVLVMVGFIVMRGLPISQYPEIVPPMINVTTTYVGASSVDVEQSVATPLEQQVNGVENMLYMKSINGNDGTLTLQVSFDVGSDLDMSNVLTQNRVSQAQASLPGPVKTYGVTIKKSLVFPLLLVTLKSPKGSYDNNFLSNYASININDLLSRTKGVGDVKLFGGSDYAMRIWVKPDRLARLGLTVPDLVNAVQGQNVISPAGQIGAEPAPTGTDFTYTVRTQGRLLTEEEFGKIILRTNPDGSQVRMGDVARIELGTLLYNQIGRNNGKPAAVIAVFQLPGSNALEVAASIKKVMADASKKFPPDLVHEISLDTTLAVEEGINEILTTLFEAILLVILVVFVFLQNWRATLIPLLTVPVSLVATFIIFPMLGFSINTLSLLGMVLAIGIVVDDAIVVVEAVMHNIEKGLSPKEATRQGDGGGLGSGGGDRADSGRRVRPRGVHGGDHRPSVPAVRDHDRDLGSLFRLQRADAQPGARGDAPEAQRRIQVVPGSVLPLVQQSVRPVHGRLYRFHRHCRPENRPEHDLYRYHHRPDRSPLSGGAGRVCSRGG